MREELLELHAQRNTKQEEQIAALQEQLAQAKTDSREPLVQQNTEPEEQNNALQERLAQANISYDDYLEYQENYQANHSAAGVDYCAAE